MITFYSKMRLYFSAIYYLINSLFLQHKKGKTISKREGKATEDEKQNSTKIYESHKVGKKPLFSDIFNKQLIEK